MKRAIVWLLAGEHHVIQTDGWEVIESHLHINDPENALQPLASYAPGEWQTVQWLDDERIQVHIPEDVPSSDQV